MKYIRTNKEILYLVSEPIYADDGACEQDCYECITSKGKTRYIYENDIVKKADSIEELVDELVVVEPNNEDCPRPYILDFFYLCTYNSWFEREKEHIKTGTIVVYGEIWVGADLHSVAKMNEKGELELL